MIAGIFIETLELEVVDKNLPYSILNGKNVQVKSGSGREVYLENIDSIEPFTINDIEFSLIRTPSKLHFSPLNNKRIAAQIHCNSMMYMELLKDIIKS
jgi:hypothetical protein